MNSTEIFLIIIAASILILIIINIRYRLQIRKMATKRIGKNLNIDFFVKELNGEFDKKLLVEVYEGISMVLTGEPNKFPALPSDVIAETYGFNDELGKQEFIECILKYSMRSIEFYKSDPLYPNLTNVEDLVYLVAAQPKLPDQEES